MSVTMDHEFAEKTNAVERYLLGESSPEERAAFEAHYFDCPVCGEHVRTGSLFVDNLRAAAQEEEDAEELPFSERRQPPARKDWFGWLRPPVLVPSFATLAMSFVIGYQNLVTLPALRQPQTFAIAALAPEARDGGNIINVDKHRPMFNVNFDVNAPRIYSSYQCTFEKENGSPVVTLETGNREVSSFTLGVLLPRDKFPDGNYVMTIRPVSERSRVIQRYTFMVHTEN